MADQSPFPKSKARVVEFADAGKDKFDELVCVAAFDREVKLRARGDRWYVWDGKAWMRRERESYYPVALNILPRQNRMARHAESVIRHAEMAAQIRADEKLNGAVTFGEDGAVLVNVQNGVLRVTEKEVKLLKHDADLLFTGCLAASWEEEAEAPNFFRVAMEALPADGCVTCAASGELEGEKCPVCGGTGAHYQGLALLQWFAGYLLFPDCKQHELFLICYGPSGTGKSTIAEAVTYVLGGDPMVTSLTLGQICAGEKAYSLPKLEHAIVNMGTELDTVDVEDASVLKMIVSGEVVEVRSIFGRPLPMVTSAKLWFNANDLPRFKHGTDAELRRVRFLHFETKPKCPTCRGAGIIEDGSETPPKCAKCNGTGLFRDRSLKGPNGALAKERNGVLRWMVSGLQQILAGVPCPEGGMGSSSVKGQFAVSNDPVRAFFEERLVRDPNGLELKETVSAEFRQFMDHRGFPPKAVDQLFRALYQRFPFIRPKRVSKGGETTHWLAGITLKE